MELNTEPSRSLVYASCPSRLSYKKEEIMDFVAAKGNGCLHPFNALPYKYFEGGFIGRKKSLEFCCRLIDTCDEFWIFGLSEGTLIETQYFLEKNIYLKKSKPLNVFIKEFDIEWERYYELYQNNFQNILDKLNLKS